MPPLSSIHELTIQFVEQTGPSAVVCFDFFDTLVTREIAPEFTKVAAAQQLSTLLGGTITGNEIYAKRQELERTICARNQASGSDPEFNLEDMARDLFEVICLRLGQLKLSGDEFADAVLKIELAVEKQVQLRSEEMVSLLQALRERTCRTMLISDFYLPGSCFEQLLDHHQLTDFFDNRYISADKLITKGSGRLYRAIIDELNLSPDSMLMIGDNPHADDAMAKEVGISSVLLDRSAAREKYDRWQQKVQNGSYHALSDPEVVKKEKGKGPECFPELAFSIWNFIHKLFLELCSDGVDTIFFLSREGEFLQKLFESYQLENFGAIRIPSRYLIVSRKSCYIASLKPLEEETFDKLFYQYRDISPRDFLLSLNFPETFARNLCDELEIAWDKRLINFPESKSFETLTRSASFGDFYERLRREQRRNFFRYLASLGFDADSTQLYLADVGWKGSMQENLYRAFQGKVRITGYYIGLLHSPFNEAGMEKKGILFSEYPQKSAFFDVYNNNRSLFEMTLGASHGSAEGYFSSHRDIEARENKLLSIHTSIQDEEGDLHIVTCEQPEEKQLFTEKVASYQLKLQESFVSINGAVLKSCKNGLPPRWLAEQHGRMVFFPSREEVQYFEELYHLENFGVFEFTRFSPPEVPPLRKKLYNLKAVISDPALLEIGFWPPVILRHMGIGFYRHVDGIKRFRKAFGSWRFWGSD